MRKLGASIAIVMAIFLGNQSLASANIQGYTWSATAMTLNLGTSSNQVGFWQALLFSNGWCITFDGIYGQQTKSATISFQNGVLGYPLPNRPADGIVGWRTWLDTQNAVDPNGYPRLINYGGGSYAYYGGGASDANLFFPGGSSTWYFMQPGSNWWYLATNARTMGSATC
jgi:peptidoglycan hydrolase-like protein with peptidoglycan-binding domain